MKNSAFNLAMSFLIQLFILSGCIKNESPVAKAGDDQTIISSFNSTITLSGEASFDPSGDPLSFFWTIEALPEDSRLVLSVFENADIEVTLDVPGIYRFGLVVMDGDSFSRKDLVIVRYYPDGKLELENYPAVVIEHPIVENMDCVDCHDAFDPDYHLAMIGFVYCGGCHYPDGWLPVKQVDHIFLSTNCVDCHQLPVIHIEIIEECKTCHNEHVWVNAFVPIFPIDPPNPNGFVHVEIGDKTCVECHSINNTGSSKPLYHVSSTDLCEVCHTIVNWIPKVPIDHSEVLGDCSNCHINYIDPVSNMIPHIFSTFVCEACHSASKWVPVVIVDHKQVIGTCFSCHDGIFASTKLEAHILSTSKCKACHNTSKWKPQKSIDHNEVIGVCVSCHVAPKNHTNVGVNAGCNDCHLAVNFGWQNSGQPLPLAN